MPSTRTRVVVARVALLLACGQSLEGAKVRIFTIDGDEIGAVTFDADPQWYWAFAAADLDLDGDDELLVMSDTAIGSATAEARSTTLLEIEAEAAWWFARRDRSTADLFAATSAENNSGLALTHAACELGESPRCVISGAIEVDEYPESIATGDFDEDGEVDVIVSNEETVTVYLSTGDDWRQPVWGPAQHLITAEGGEDAVLSTDLDGDGHLDIVVAARRLGVRLFFGAGDGTFGQVRPAINDELEVVYAVSVVAIDDDDAPELLLATDGGVIVLRRLRGRVFGDAGLPIARVDPLAWPPQWAPDAVPGDFDGDGRDEIMLIDSSGLMRLAEIGGPSTDWTVTEITGRVAEPYYLPYAVAADFDGDGRQALGLYLGAELPMECSIGGAAARRRSEPHRRTAE